MFNYTLKKHLIHLYIIFQLLNFYNISLLSKKLFLNNFTIALLKQKVNVFDLIIVNEKLKAIIKLDFFYTFKKLKIYLSLID